MAKKFFLAIILIPVLVFFIPLVHSIIQSGYHYVYDVDELFHSHIVYLIAHGQKPYASFYSIYSPLFHFAFLPLFTKFGFTFETIDLVRKLMIVLFGIRLLLQWVLVKKLFGKIIASISVILLLLDPFTVFTAMQIRPDNLMLTVYILGLLFLVFGFDSQNRTRLFIGGALVVSAFLMVVKILPSVLLIFGILAVVSWKKKDRSLFGMVMMGAGGALISFIGYFLLNGTLREMIQQMLIDPVTFLGTIGYPVPAGFFYLPNNTFIYGLGGKPLTWVYVWVFLVLGMAGAYHVLHLVLRKKILEPLDGITLALVGSLLAQWIIIFFITAFMQYYIPITWLLSVFGAVAIGEVLVVTRRSALLHIGTLFSLVGLFVFLAHTSISANRERSKITSDALKLEYAKRWSQIPEDSYVFPEILFRPEVYPLQRSYFIGLNAGYLVRKYPDASQFLEKYRVNYIVSDDYVMGYLSSQTKTYIGDHFTKVPGDTSLFVRKGTAMPLQDTP